MHIGEYSFLIIYFKFEKNIFCNTLKHTHSQAFNMEAAEALVREMEEEGIDATMDIYHTMMDGYTMIKNEDKCLIVYKRLKVTFFLFF